MKKQTNEKNRLTEKQVKQIVKVAQEESEFEV